MKVRQIRRRAKSQYVVMDGMKLLRDAIGKRCRSYVAGCASCDSWRFRDEHGRFAYNWDELREYMDKTEAQA